MESRSRTCLNPALLGNTVEAKRFYPIFTNRLNLHFLSILPLSQQACMRLKHHRNHVEHQNQQPLAFVSSFLCIAFINSFVFPIAALILKSAVRCAPDDDSSPGSVALPFRGGLRGDGTNSVMSFFSTMALNGVFEVDSTFQQVCTILSTLQWSHLELWSSALQVLQITSGRTTRDSSHEPLPPLPSLLFTSLFVLEQSHVVVQVQLHDRPSLVRSLAQLLVHEPEKNFCYNNKLNQSLHVVQLGW